MFHSAGNSVGRLYACLYAALSLLSVVTTMKGQYRLRYAGALVVGSRWLILPAAVQAIDFDYQLIAGPNTPIPGGSGNFGGVSNPTMYGGVVAFAGGASHGDGLYTYNSGTLNLIADSTTPLPGGTGNFLNYGTPSIHDGMLAFTGEGSGGQLGIYCYNGEVNRIADLNTPIPEGTGNFTEFGTPWMHDGGIVFRARGSGGQDGIYAFAKGVLRVVADTNSPVPGGLGNFTNFGHISPSTGILFGTPTAENGVFVFTGGDGERQQGIYTESDGTFAVVADTNTRIPSGTGNFVDFREGVLAANIYDGDIAFLGEGENDQLGMYLKTGATFSKIVDRNDSLPDESSTFFSIAGQGMGLDQGHVSFLGGAISQGGNIYTTLGGKLTSVIDEGDLLEGRTVGSMGTYGQGLEGPIVLFQAASWGRQGDHANFIAIAEYHWTGQGGGWTGPTDGEWDNRANWLVGRLPRDVVDTFIDPAASITVVGPAADTQLRQLQIGGGAGIATLQLQSGATITANAGVIIQDTGVLTGDGLIGGDLTNSGVIVADNITATGRFDNMGVVRGSGRIHADNFTNFAAVRVSAGEHLRLTGSGFLNDSGRVEAIGTTSNPAAIEFDGTVTNNAPSGLITGRNAIMRFDGGLINEGSLAVTVGVSDVFGDIENTGTVAVTGGAAATFYDDIIQNGTFQVSKVGSTTSVAVVLGDFTGAGGSSGGGDIFFEGDLRPGNSTAVVSYANNVSFGSAATMEIELGGLIAGQQHDRVDIAGAAAANGTLDVSLIGDFTPAAGDTFEILTAAGGVSGTFADAILPALTGDLFWNVNYSANSVMLQVAAPGIAGDYNQDGSVDAADYVVWRKTDGTPEGYDAWRANFGQKIGSGSVAIANATVPEPATLVMLMFAAAGWCVRRCRAE